MIYELPGVYGSIRKEEKQLMNNPERVTVRGGEKSRTDRKQREIWTESYCFVFTLPNVTVCLLQREKV